MSNNKSNGYGRGDPPKTNLRHEAAPGMALADLALLAIFITSLVLVPMALFAMGEESGPAASLKYLLVGFAAAGAAYGVNRFAIDRLAPLHALGFGLAGALAVTGILLTGSGTALGSFTGIVFKSVEVRTFQDAGRDLTAFIANANEAALLAERIGPAVNGIADGIDQTARCEVASSCLSGNGAGGRGPMSRALESVSAQAFSVAEALQAGALERNRLLEDLNRLNTAYHAVLADSRRAVSERRAALQALHAEVRQVAAALSEAMPIALVRGFAQGLRESAALPADPSGSRVLNTYLRAHADRLAGQMDRMPQAELTAPAFPDRPGMVEVLLFLPAYIAIAAIVIVGELILPLSLYLMTYMQRVRELEILERAPATAARKDPFEGLINRSNRDDLNDDGASS